MDQPKNVDALCIEHGIDARKLAELSGVDEQRVMAIVLGRWTPSPNERDAIAAVFGLTRTRSSGATRRPSSISTARGQRELAHGRVNRNGVE